MRRRSPEIGNVLLLGYEEAARRIYRDTRFHGGLVLVTVDDSGKVLVRSSTSFSPIIGNPSHFVGLYNRGWEIEQLREDLKARVLEIAGHIIGIAA